MRADEIDDRDQAILRALMSDGRLTSLALAERVHLSSSACLRRVRLLEESGLTAGYVMPLDPDFAGLSGAAFVSVALEQQGRATLDRLERDERRHPEIIDNAMEAIRRAGLAPVKTSIRGGTDGSRLSFMGLPCPNIFAGEHAFHSRLEWVSVQDMEKAVQTIVHLAMIWEERA